MTASISSINPEHESRARLTDYILNQAASLKRDLGFGWSPEPAAPETYSSLRHAFAHSRATGAPLPVSSDNSGSVIFTRPDVNFAFRYVHDCSHVLHGLSFSLSDEYELALIHLADLEQAGFTPDSAEYALYRADTLGQVIVNAIAKRFPYEQERFGLGCLRVGLDRGILAELQRFR